MSQGTLYIHKHSPRSNWFGVLVKHLKLDIKVEAFDDVENFKSIFPLGKAPAFVEADGYKLTESVAILEYLLTLANDETYKGKTVKDKAQVLRWLSFVNQDMVAVWGKFFFGSKTDEEKATNSKALRTQFEYIEKELSTRQYLALDYITIADLYLFAWYNYFAGVVGEKTAEEFPALTKWYADVKAKDAIAADIANSAH